MAFKLLLNLLALAMALALIVSPAVQDFDQPVPQTPPCTSYSNGLHSGP